MKEFGQFRVTEVVPQDSDPTVVLVCFFKFGQDFGTLIPTSANIKVGDIIALYGENFFNGNRAVKVITPTEGELINY